MTQILVGCDPEVFVKKKGVFLSAFGLIAGDKKNPQKIRRGAVQVDGMALEFNINPADTAAAFEDNISSVLQQTMGMVPGYEIFVEPVAIEALGVSLPKSVADFGEAYIASQPREAKELGCTPDFNAYTKKENPRPDADFPFRTASGHVHIGWTNGVDVNDPGHLEACYSLVKSLDVWLGIPSLSWDSEDRRRQLYGKAGAFRPKHYGLEYRVLSNKWITSLQPIFLHHHYRNTRPLP